VVLDQEKMAAKTLAFAILDTESEWSGGINILWS
jgi:hypothetical protein